MKMDDKKTQDTLTRFEKAHVIGVRAKQIAYGAPAMIDTEGETDPLKISEKEYEANVIPLTIRRHLPDGTFEDCDVRDLINI